MSDITLEFDTTVDWLTLLRTSYRRWSRLRCAWLHGDFCALGLDDVLGSRVVDFEAVCSFLDCHLVLVDHLDQF